MPSPERTLIPASAATTDPCGRSPCAAPTGRPSHDRPHAALSVAALEIPSPADDRERDLRHVAVLGYN